LEPQSLSSQPTADLVINVAVGSADSTLFQPHWYLHGTQPRRPVVNIKLYGLMTEAHLREHVQICYMKVERPQVKPTIACPLYNHNVAPDQTVCVYYYVKLEPVKPQINNDEKICNSNNNITLLQGFFYRIKYFCPLL